MRPPSITPSSNQTPAACANRSGHCQISISSTSHWPFTFLKILGVKFLEQLALGIVGLGLDECRRSHCQSTTPRANSRWWRDPGSCFPGHCSPGCVRIVFLATISAPASGKIPDPDPQPRNPNRRRESSSGRRPNRPLAPPACRTRPVFVRLFSSAWTIVNLTRV